MGQPAGETKPMKRICAGLLAHVDAGKTTLSEAMLYEAGALRRLGRVDHRDAFLDTNALERERGITIFSKQALLPLPHTSVTLLDTPGHADFSSEMERTLQVLDYAVLVVSGVSGVQSHTRTVWRLLRRYRAPVFLFVNKMDLPGASRRESMEELRRVLSDRCVDFSAGTGGSFWEDVAENDEDALAEYLAQGSVSDARLAGMIRARRLFPVFFGSALKCEGVGLLLRALDGLTCAPAFPPEFSARVYKIMRDPQGARLTCLKVTGGALRVRDLLRGGGEPGWEEKIDQIRLYSGDKYRAVQEAPAGTVCAVTGLSRTLPGMGLGALEAAAAPALEPVLAYRVELPPGCDAHAALRKLEELEEEDPQLHIAWDAEAREIRLQLMGEIQLEVLQRVIAERFGLDVSFGAGRIVYRETISNAVEGAGHFEPLRHYAEVHLLLEPGPRGSGIQLASACSEDALDRNWQRLILSHLEECEHPGVLTGSPITDLKITLVAGRAHVKHTEGGDFRQATFRALRQGLRKARSVLLEPYYAFRLEVPAGNVGRAMADLQRRGAEFSPPEPQGELTLLRGSGPVSELRGYQTEVTAYTQGRGQFLCAPQGYRECHDAARVIEAMGYDPDRDLAHPADSVFCSHGAGYTVKWDEAGRYMHVDSGLRWDGPGGEAPPERPAAPARRDVSDDELRAVFEMTYGKAKRPEPFRRPRREEAPAPAKRAAVLPEGPEYLLVDGYNLIFAWEDLKSVADGNVDAARKILMDRLSNYQGFKKCEVILVFDAYRVPRGVREVTRYHNIYVVYTKEAETADSYIEKATYEIGRRHRVRVATSDNLEQLIILGHGALRISARAFREELEEAEQRIRALAEENRRKNRMPFTPQARGGKEGEPCSKG